MRSVGDDFRFMKANPGPARTSAWAFAARAQPPRGQGPADNARDVLRSAQIVAEYGFLLTLCTADAIIAAADRARDLDVPPHTTILTHGHVDAAAYVRAMASTWDVPVIGPALSHGLRLRPSQRTLTTDGLSQRRPWHLAVHPHDAIFEADGQQWLVLDGLSRRPRDLRLIIRELAREGVFPALTTPDVLRSVVLRETEDQLVTAAADGLRVQRPLASAALGLTHRQGVALGVIPALLLGAALVVRDDAWTALFALLTLPFVISAALRLLALGHAIVRPRMPDLPPQLADVELPVYTLLIPLFRETAVLRPLIRALRSLDYPAEKLDIKLILEAIDRDTIAAVTALGLRAPFDVIIVPDRLPHTKPKALNYALHFARGSLVAVFDAEDIPDADQLRQAVARFRSAAPGLGCVQGRLTIDNGPASWLAQQFTLDYLTLFDALLPALQAMRLPLPLGGTSNHFPIDVLRRAGGWDAYNVTEDADLGVRLARQGWRVEMLTSRTYEEAPARLRSWLPQRTRWMKGYLQTWFVHMRKPRRLWRELGWRGAIGFHTVIGGVVLAALMQPVFLAGLVAGAMTGGLWVLPDSRLGQAFHVLAVANLVIGYGAAFLLTVVATLKARRFELLMHLPLVPLYWCLISLAAWRALWQLRASPFHWEKTEHGLSRRRTARSKRLVTGARRQAGGRRQKNSGSGDVRKEPAARRSQSRGARRPAG